MFERGKEVFHKRRIARNFEEAKTGDLIFGYSAQPHMQVVALARVKDELGMYMDIDIGEKVEGILIEPLAELPHPVSYRTIYENEILKQSEPMRNRAQGTLFRLSTEEAQELARLLNDEGNDVRLPTGARGDFAEFVTFHQSFAYEEFVEGLRPVTVEETDEETGELRTEIQYRVMPGVFRRICTRAEAAWQIQKKKAPTRKEDAPKYLLVIDEINRANIAKVLGELITLIEDDKRLGKENEVKVTLPMSVEKFGVPPNLYILGTMNTADRSIALLDLALRRRFTFVEMKPDASLITPALVEGVNLRDLLEVINKRILLLLDQDHLIGHSYFLNVEDAKDLRFKWYKRVVPLLQEYFYNDYERLKAVIGDKFVTPVKNMEPTQTALLGDLVESAQPPQEIAFLEDMNEFLLALRELAGAVKREKASGVENVEQE